MLDASEPRVRDFGGAQITYDNGVWLQPGGKPLRLGPKRAKSLSVECIPGERRPLEPGRPAEGAAAEYYNGRSEGRDDEAPSIVDSTTSRDGPSPSRNPERQLSRKKSTMDSVKSLKDPHKLKNNRVVRSISRMWRSWTTNRLRKSTQVGFEQDPPASISVARRHSVANHPYGLHSAEDHEKELQRRGHCKTCKCKASHSTLNSVASPYSFTQVEKLFYQAGKNYGYTRTPARWVKRTVWEPVFNPSVISFEEPQRGRPRSMGDNSGRSSGERHARALPERRRSRRKLASSDDSTFQPLPKTRSTKTRRSSKAAAVDKSPIHQRKSSKRAGKQPLVAERRSKHAVAGSDITDNSVAKPLPRDLKSNSRVASAPDHFCEQILPAAIAGQRPYEEPGHSPSSSTSSQPAWRCSEDGCDTPLTSQCSSPVKGAYSPCKARPIPQRLPALALDFVQLDGSIDHQAKDDGVALVATTVWERDAEDDVGHGLRSRTPHPRMDLTNPVDNDNAMESSDFAEDATPLVRACKAKDPHAANPFPRICSPTTPLSPQRLPSKFLSHTERSPPHRQRRVVADTIETPDRFIPARSGTPTKEALLLRRSAKKPKHGSPSTSPAFPHCVDPFGPASSRTARMAEQFATLRRLPTGAGMSSRAATLVPEARPTSPRAVSAGAVWSVGGTIVTEGVASVTNGRGGRVTSGTSAPHYMAGFLHRQTPSEDEIQHGERLAVAMEVEQTARMFTTPPSASASPFSMPRRSCSETGRGRTFWSNNAWERDTPSSSARSSPRKVKEVPNIPFRVLDAPQLRDDFYCSLIAYTHTMQCLAVGLGQHVYLWSENRGTTPTHIPDSLTSPLGAHVTSLSFSSAAGGSAILAIGRGDRQITLWSPMDLNPRFSSEQPAPVSCVCFRPNPVKRPSVREPGMLVNTEELLVGDKVGHVYYYSIEWPAQSDVDLFDWQGSMTLLARLECHTQQICGMAWSADGEYFATGSNDNQIFLYESRKLLRSPRSGTAVSTMTVRNRAPGGSARLVQNSVLAVMPGEEKHLFTLSAAVKAIAFAPWQSSLVAAGGGSNDRCIHFFHAVSGATLATIDCYAQVTSLVWSEKKQELAVTFGFAQPEHPYRVAVFAWPSCRRVVGIPWWGEERALSAVAYPGGPHGGPGHRIQRINTPMSGQARRTREEGCLVVATSDASIKFHEIWPDGSEQGREKFDRGRLGGGSILENELSPTLLRRTTIR